MLSNKEKSILRSSLFRHLDGIVTCPAAYILKEKGITKYLLKKKSVSLTEITSTFNANDGYLNVALRTLCSQGWLNQQVNNTTNTVHFEINELSAIAFSYFDIYKEAYLLLKFSKNYNSRKFETEPFLKLEELYQNFKNNFNVSSPPNSKENEILNQILTHIEGIIIGPTVVLLGMSGMFHKYFMQTKFKAEEFHKDAKNFSRLLDILTGLDWFTKTGDSYEFTNKGLFFARRASAYGVTVSYIPTLRKLDKLIFEDSTILRNANTAAEEVHVDREMNVWGSGGAHAAYFRVIDEIIINLFNKPIHEQPKGILDVGCGNGAFLKHLFNVIENQTNRGKVLEEYPLLLIGVDYNEAALKITRKNLVQADIWAKVIWGDIGNPKAMSEDLQQKYNINLSDLLNVRTFLDHNRIWEEPKLNNNIAISTSTGAYAHKGKRLDNNLVIESLKQHFKKWTPYIHKFGLLLIELHTSKPELVSQNLGRTAATAYDATHGYSDQYIIEIEEYMNAMKSIGLIPDENTFKKFPNSDLATVSINLFKPKVS
ncbi:class I SAM-dependent methyltransferase [Tenacibaculum sp. E3R01]|uniref:class I SAM-dependent methyltransferase n=1 Tax=Tenacibaculum sp. E3R01 TaxID=2267227 RepID=UPI000DEB0622|nr:class I SAM-dependent methyltransferase [Tenacibaculum sp. E3R01]RBW63235.1 class I SAM-dependent methyltransferase [Tenacibaculum sp. E3R01]